MNKLGVRSASTLLAITGLTLLAGCRTHMPHAFTWPAGGDIQQTHAKPPEGGYYSNWDPFAVSLEVTPLEDVNPVRTQHVLVATVRDKDGKALPNRRVEWIINEGSVGDIVEVDESGWRASRGYKVNNHYAISHTNNFEHVLDMGNDDPSDDIQLEEGQTWCVITSPVEGDTHITVYAPGIYDWSQHKVFAVKHWYDVAWEFPPPATNPVGTDHQFVTRVSKFSDGSPLVDYRVTYRIVDGPAATFEGGNQTITVPTDGAGEARVTLRQVQPAEGTNNVEVDIVRPGDQCCNPEVHIATGMTSKTWIGPKIAINKTAPAQKMVNEEFQYNITVSNPSAVDATNVQVSDTLPDGIQYVSSSPSAQSSGQALSWSLGTLGPGASQNITVTVHGTRTGTFENCAVVNADFNLSDRSCATTVITAPELQLEKSCPPEVMLCEPIEYVLTVRNTGDGPANNVKITDELPDGVVTENGRSSVTVEVGTLGPGQAKQARFMARAERTGSFTNMATATADNNLTASAECTTVVRQPMLEVVKTGPELRYIGRDAEYTITVRNTGDAPATNTVLTDTLPNGARFVSASNGGQMSGNQVTWSMGTLEAGATREVTLTIQPTQIGTVTNTARATAVCAEADASVAMEVKGIPAILLEVIDLEDPVEIGNNVTYLITVTNQGSAVGTNIVLTCELEQAQEYVSSDGPTRAQAENRTITFAALPSLAPKAKATFQVVAKAVEQADVRFRVQMTTDQQSRPIIETESTNCY